MVVEGKWEKGGVKPNLNPYPPQSSFGVRDQSPIHSTNNGNEIHLPTESWPEMFPICRRRDKFGNRGGWS